LAGPYSRRDTGRHSADDAEALLHQFDFVRIDPQARARQRLGRLRPGGLGQAR